MSRTTAWLRPYLFVHAIVDQDVEALRDGRRPDLSTAAKALLCAYARHADGEGRAWPGTLRLQGETGLSVSTLRRGRDELAAAGVIRVETLGSGKSTTRIRLLYDAAEGRHHDTTGGSTTTSPGVSDGHPRDVTVTRRGVTTTPITAVRTAEGTARDARPNGRVARPAACPHGLCDGSRFVVDDDARSAVHCRCHPQWAPARLQQPAPAPGAAVHDAHVDPVDPPDDKGDAVAWRHGRRRRPGKASEPK